MNIPNTKHTCQALERPRLEKIQENIPTAYGRVIIGVNGLRYLRVKCPLGCGRYHTHGDNPGEIRLSHCPVVEKKARYQLAYINERAAS